MKSGFHSDRPLSFIPGATPDIRACSGSRPGARLAVAFWARRITMICTVHPWRLLIFMATVATIALPFRLDSARSAAVSAQEATTRSSPSETSSTTDTVTIEARREKELKRQITKFVSGAVFTYLNDSLER